jgi:ribokinase
VRAALEREGVGVAGVVTTATAATGTALIAVDAAGQNQIAVAPGANRALGVEHVRARAEDFAWAEIVVCQLETPLPTVRAALELARGHGATTILNPAPVPDAPIDFWRLCDYLVPNEVEAEQLSGVPVPDRAGAGAAARVLRDLGVGTVIVTLGAAGVVACGAEGECVSPAFAVAVVDTTGAGDAFNAALAVALAEGRPLPDALRFGNATAGLTCTRRGAQPSLPPRAEVDRLLAEG